ncbi:MAG: ATP-dependent 6-phosphofructokinase [Anaerolineae bacterium]|nr:ATP-dependent 6-phosphofructokinase [Anaerolineae bacterium]
MKKKIGLLTSGSDLPGLNAAIRAIGKSARAKDIEIIGFQDGFYGLVHDQYTSIEKSQLSGILTTGGTILGTSRDTPQQMSGNNKISDKTEEAIKTYRKHNLSALVCLGGKETQESAYNLSKNGLNIITLPKAIDNHLPMTDTSVGFDTAMEVAAEAIDRLHSTAHSHHRIIIVEIMGNNSGWLTLGAGIAGGADVILIPEIPYEVDKVAEAIAQRNKDNKRFSIIAVAEGASPKDYHEFHERLRQNNERLRDGDDRRKVSHQLDELENRNLMDNAALLDNRLSALTGLDTRITILGYLLRGGVPSALDRLLATQLGTACVSMICKDQFGVMASVQQNSIVPVPLEQVAGKIKQVPADHPWLLSARSVGTCMGD